MKASIHIRSANGSNTLEASTSPHPIHGNLRTTFIQTDEHGAVYLDDAGRKALIGFLTSIPDFEP